MSRKIKKSPKKTYTPASAQTQAREPLSGKYLFLAKAPEFFTSVFMMLILGLFPIYFDQFGLTAILEAKLVFFLYASCIYLVLLTLTLIAQVLTGLVSLPPLREIPGRLWRGSSFSQKMIVLLALSAIVSTLLSPNRVMSWLGYIRYEGLRVKLLYWGIFLAVSLFGRLNDSIGIALGFSGVFMGAVSILQYIGQNPFGIFPAGMSYPLNDLTKMYIGTIGNINSAAGFYCLMLPFFIAAIILLRTKWRLLYFIPLLLNFFVLLFTDAKQGLVGIGVGMLLLAPFLLNTAGRIRNGLLIFAGLFLTAAFHFSLHSSLVVGYTPAAGGPMVTFSFAPGTAAWIALAAAAVCAAGWAFLRFRGAAPRIDPTMATRTLIVYVGMIIVAAFAFLLFAPAGKDPANGLLYEASQVVRGQADDSFGSQRLFIWRRVPELVREYPLFGSGPDTFGPRFSAAYQPEIMEYLKEDIMFDHAENEYLSLLVNLGFVGLAFYLLALGGEAVRWLKGRKTAPRLMLGFALLCASVQLFFTSSSVIVSPAFWVIWGLLQRTKAEREPANRIIRAPGP